MQGFLLGDALQQRVGIGLESRKLHLMALVCVLHQALQTQFDLRGRDFLASALLGETRVLAADVGELRLGFIDALHDRLTAGTAFR